MALILDLILYSIMLSPLILHIDFLEICYNLGKYNSVFRVNNIFVTWTHHSLYFKYIRGFVQMNGLGIMWNSGYSATILILHCIISLSFHISLLCLP